MNLTQSPVVIGVFSTHEQARAAVEHLRRAGFNDEDIGYLTGAAVAKPDTEVEANAAEGAVEGGVLGGLLGAAVALLIPGLGPALAGGIVAATLGGVTLGATAGGLIGALNTYGVSETDAQTYQNDLAQGQTIVTVKISMGYEEAERILRESGATTVKTHSGVINEVHPPRTSPPPNDLEPTSDTITPRE
ncbi:general stress protein [Tengunoibacter tsumagoiensis]|uniref:Membrane protein n=1 Tax=Tengunoibacter tsumagoiensis TaxID=2014871 RepID=A0A401ZVT8_9CHLR|nr:general stress protein [Tengunoibacter tsumagoiensis]GCE10916.1 membrane protein [Tengunoibacter tsumagoiensis]